MGGQPPLTPVPETTVKMTEEEILKATVDEANMTVADEDQLLYDYDDDMNEGTAKLGGDAQADRPTQVFLAGGSNTGSTPADSRGYKPFFLATGPKSGAAMEIGNESANLFAATWV